MSIFFSTDDRPCCKHCGGQLAGYVNSGHCPSCGKWYAVDRASIAPSRTRALVLLLHSHRPVTGNVSGAWTGVAGAMFIAINAGIVILLAYLAIRPFITIH